MKRMIRTALLMAGLSVPALAQGPVVPSKQAPQPTVEVKKQAQRPELDVVFVLDTTGSMGGLIEGAKQKIWSIASRMASGTPTPKIRVGLVAFRDVGDAYVTKRFDLSEDLDTVYKNLQSFSADGGGDGPEHVGKAMGEAVQLMSWSQNKQTSRMIFVVGDAPPHDDYNDGWNSKTWAKNAIQKGIVVNTIRCGAAADTQTAFQEIARLADGSFVTVGQTGGMVAVATPFDDEIGKLNGSLASTTVYAGSASARAAGAGKMAEQAALAPSVAADRASYVKKSGLKSFAADNEGTVDLAAAPEKLKEMKKEALPEPMQKMNEEERVAFVTKNAAERKEIETKLRTLSDKRSAWMVDNAKNNKDSFDEQVFESVKKSASKVGVTY